MRNSLWRLGTALVLSFAALQGTAVAQTTGDAGAGQATRGAKLSFAEYTPPGWSAGRVSFGTGDTSPNGSERVREVQRRLRSRGFDPGAQDGIFGPRTEAAVRAYQRAEDQEVTGGIDAPALHGLRNARGEANAPRVAEPGTGERDPQRSAAAQRPDRTERSTKGQAIVEPDSSVVPTLGAGQSVPGRNLPPVLESRRRTPKEPPAPSAELRTLTRQGAAPVPPVVTRRGEPQGNSGALALFETVALRYTTTPLVWLPFGLLGLIAWSVWLGRRFLTSRYRPTENEHREPVSVVAPAFREDPEILVSAVRTWLENRVEEIIILMPQDEQENIDAAQRAFTFDPQVRILATADHDKRRNLAIGIRAATNPVVILSDSDTLWEPDLRENLVMPFADPTVGGVGTRQRVLDPHSSTWRRAADWMLDAKYLTYIPAMAREGAVSCLSGRTVAYRRELLLPMLPELVDEHFWGRRCESGDDGRLTWLVLNKGYKTTYQINAVAWTMMPDSARGFFMQRLRWSRNSYRCYLRAIFRGGLFKQPVITRVSVIQGLVAPLSLTIGFAFTGLAIARADWLAVAAWGCWITCGRGIRAYDHLRHNPRNLLLLPLMTAIILFGLTLIKYYTFFTMNKQAWITRRVERGVAEGQGRSSLDHSLEALTADLTDGQGAKAHA